MHGLRTRQEGIKDETLRNQGRGMKESRTRHGGVSRTRDEETKDETRRDQGQIMKKSRTRHERTRRDQGQIMKKSRTRHERADTKGSRTNYEEIKDET